MVDRVSKRTPFFSHQTRGVFDETTVAALTTAWETADASPAPCSTLGGRAPSDAARDAAAVLALHTLLGGGADAAAMVVREPLLLATPPSLLAARLLALRVDGASAGVDVAALAAAQPDLLLQDAPASPEEPSARARAWAHGLAGDGDAEWEGRRETLADYVAVHGDAAVGTRGGDDARLARWAAKQRADHKKKVLSAEREAALAALGFEFSADDAEFGRWLAAARGTGGQLNQSDALYLENWMSVQRVAKRCGALAPHRVAALDAIGFDWSGADALS